MPLEVQIGVFWLFVFAVLWTLRRKPNSFAAKIAFSWHGPFPRQNEKKSSYYRRKSLFALGWLLQLLTATALVLIATWAMPRLQESEPFLLVTGFALTIGLGMALLGALLAYLTSLKAQFLGPDPQFIPLSAQGNAEDKPPTEA